MKLISYDDKYEQDILDIAWNFYNEAFKEYDAVFDINVIKQSIQTYKKDSFLLLNDVKCEGILAGMTVNSLSGGGKMFQEVIWYVNEKYRKYGIYMLKEAEKRLKDQGYTAIIMALLFNSKADKIDKLYKRMGYNPFETHYIRNL
jgi:GNAT superfamily N-acetyltransferase